MSAAINPEPCRWCGMYHGPLCPTVKAIEYYHDGRVKRVEFKGASDYPQLVAVDPMKPPFVVTYATDRVATPQGETWVRAGTDRAGTPQGETYCNRSTGVRAGAGDRH